MMRSRLYILVMVAVVFFFSCKEKKTEGPVVTPWGEVGETAIPSGDGFSLSDIVSNGEMIVVTMSGPDTYYEDRGRGMGAHYLLCERFAQSIGVSLRVELCGDTLEMVSRLENGSADVIVFPLPDGCFDNDSLVACARYEASATGGKQGAKGSVGSGAWAVSSRNAELAAAINGWYEPGMMEEVKKEMKQMLAAPRVTRRVFSPFLNRSGGVISKYDALFKKYAPVARWDWRLMAAQCYQESCFDPDARSWAGARGLMQLMPKTAEHLGLSMEQIHEPEANVRAAAQYISELNRLFIDIPSAAERQNFVLASYNGGIGHVRDAMALTRKMGGNAVLWRDVSKHLLLLRDPQYYRDPVVKHGYVRSTETYDYVERIRERYAQYRGVPAGKGGGVAPVPRKATKKHRYHV